MTRAELTASINECEERVQALRIDSLRDEGLAFLAFAADWLLMGDLAGAKNAYKNAESVFRPLWRTERYISTHR